MASACKELIHFLPQHDTFESLQLDELQQEGIIRIIREFAQHHVMEEQPVVNGPPSRRHTTVKGAFQYFLKEGIKRLRKTSGHQDYAVLVATVSDQWKQLPLVAKQQYKERARFHHLSEKLDSDESVPSSDNDD
jgi:hypothetical protein